MRALLGHTFHLPRLFGPQHKVLAKLVRLV